MNLEICSLSNFTEPASNSAKKDTVLVSLRVLGGSGHVEQDKPCIVGFVDNDLVEFDSSVHAPDVGVVPERRRRHV